MFVPIFCFCVMGKVIASGKAADSPAMLDEDPAATTIASSNASPSPGSGPVLGFSSSFSQVVFVMRCRFLIAVVIS